jgi:hypothetical protein
MHRALFSHVQLDDTEGFTHDVTDRGSGSSCYTIHAGLYTGRTLEPLGCSHCGDGPPRRILHTSGRSYTEMTYVQSLDNCSIASVVGDVQRC